MKKGRFFWELAFIPKEMQEHINKTLKRAMHNNSSLPNPDIHGVVGDFVKSSEMILSASRASNGATDIMKKMPTKITKE